VLVEPVSCWRVAGVNLSYGVSGGGPSFAILMPAAGWFCATEIRSCDGGEQKKAGARKGKAGAKEANAAAAVPAPATTAGKSAPPAAKGPAAGTTAPAAGGKAGGKGEAGIIEKNFMNELMDESTRARVDVDTHDLIDIGELQQLDDISGLNDDEIDGFFSPSAGGAKGGGGGLGDLDLGDFDLDMDAFAETPRAAQHGGDLSFSAATPKAMDIDVPLDHGDAVIVNDVGGATHDAAALEAARKAEQAKDEEILAKPMTQLPPVVRRPGLFRGRNASAADQGISDGVPWYYLGVTYGASAPPPAIEVESEAPNDANKDAAMLALPDSKPAIKQEGDKQGGHPALRAMPVPPMMMHGKMHGRTEQNAAHRLAAVKRHAEVAGGSMINGQIVKKEASGLSGRTLLSLYSVNKIWESSRSVCIDSKCSRSSLLLSHKDGAKRMHHGAGKLLPLEHLMAHQMALTCHDMPLTANLTAPNAPLVAMSVQAVRTAFVVRTQLIKDGLSSAAHLSFEHMMRAELGDDGRVMMALDPLSLPADATSVGYSIAKVLPALDRLVPGLRREMKVLDLASLLGHPGRDVQEVAERLPAPQLLVGEADSQWVEVPPPALRWWEKLPLEPYGNKKDVIYCVICGSGSSVQQASQQQSEQEIEAGLFFKELSCVYQAANLGTHRCLESKHMEEPKQRGASAPPAAPVLYNNAIVSVKPVKAGAMGGPGHGYRPGALFEEACTRALKGLVHYFELDKSSSVLPVLYVLEPDFALGNTWSVTPPQHHQTPAQARAEWQRALAKSVASLAVGCPRILDLVVQIVPVQRINMGRKMQWLLRDMAMAVYTKGRVRPRARYRTQHADTIMDLEDETHSFFSASMLSIKKKEKVERKLYEPLLTVPLAHTSDAAFASSAAQGGGADQEPVPMLHCGYAWSDDGLCLGAAVTDCTGEMLETFTALFGGTLSHSHGEARMGSAGAESARDSAWRWMLQRLWNSIYEWICVSYSRPVRLVVGVLGGGMDLARDLAHWRVILEKVRCGAPGAMCCEVMFVELGIVRSLQLLSRCERAGGALLLLVSRGAHVARVLVSCRVRGRGRGLVVA